MLHQHPCSTRDHFVCLCAFSPTRHAVIQTATCAVCTGVQHGGLNLAARRDNGLGSVLVSLCGLLQAAKVGVPLLSCAILPVGGWCVCMFMSLGVPTVYLTDVGPMVTCHCVCLHVVQGAISCLSGWRAVTRHASIMVVV